MSQALTAARLTGSVTICWASPWTKFFFFVLLWFFFFFALFIYLFMVLFFFPPSRVESCSYTSEHAKVVISLIICFLWWGLKGYSSCLCSEILVFIKIFPVHMDLNDLNKVWEVKPLRRIRENEAREILETVAKQVQPIMRKRKWKVKVLSEFCPANPALLGLNIGGGAEVKLRLRRPNNELDFFPYNQILDTMLHELCHNEYGPHNADFYNLLDEIRKECEDLMAKGITGTGQGFDLPGRRLGGFSRQPPLSSLRQSALAAAENRARRAAILPSGPMRLGGDSSIKAALSPIQAAAMAAERRLHDDVWCGSKSAESEGSSESSKSSAIHDNGSHLTSDLGPTHSQGSKDLQPSWQCSICTLLNQPLSLICEACGNMKGVSNEKKSKVWSCKFCTLDNNVEVERCLACGEWRYSYGPPAVPLVESGGVK